MESETAQLLIQGGAVGIALVVLGILYKVVTNHQTHTDSVIERNTEASVKATVMHETLSKSIERMSEIIEKKQKSKEV